MLEGLKNPQECFQKVFKMRGLQKAFQNSSCHPSLLDDMDVPETHPGLKPPGVLEDKDVPETFGDGVGRVETSQGMFPASLKMIG